jgi:hypothetical protein
MRVFRKGSDQQIQIIVKGFENQKKIIAALHLVVADQDVEGRLRKVG